MGVINYSDVDEVEVELPDGFLTCRARWATVRPVSGGVEDDTISEKAPLIYLRVISDGRMTTGNKRRETEIPPGEYVVTTHGVYQRLDA